MPAPMDPLRILLLVEGYNALGGIAEVVDSLAVELTRVGHTVSVVSTLDRRARRNAHERVARSGIDCTYFEIWNRKPLSLRHLETLFKVPFHTRWGELARFIRQWRPDVVNSHLWAWDRYPTVIGACRAAAVPMIQTFHVSDDRGRGRLGERGLRALDAASAIVAVAAATRDHFAKLLPKARDAYVIPGGVDCEAAQAAPAAVRARPYILCACRFDLKHKAMDVLIDAFKPIADEFADVDLLLAGGGPDIETIRQRIVINGLDKRVEMLGVKSREEMRSLYKGAILFALPSRPGEGLPLVFLEALAAGAPVIATDTGGAAEVIRNGETGTLVSEEDVAGLASAIREL
ncbi:MAG TPA: glycosyltransferase family 4 protein, partial [Candidatus Binataceae bacterium]|nr:glycosyltransferase family 4 protein [Candidatus Binataceae bacterium]